MVVLKGIISLHRAEEEKPIEIFKAKIKIGQKHRSISAFKRNQVFFPSPKNNGKKFNLTSFYLTTPRNQQEKQTISLYQPNSNSFGNYPCCLTLLVSKCV